MQSGKIRWLLALLPALAVMAPGGAVSGVDQRPAVATKQDQGEPPQIQIIRRVSVGGVYPVERKVTGESREAKAKVNSNPNPSTKLSAGTVRSNPARSTRIRSTKARSTSVQRTPVRRAPGRA